MINLPNSTHTVRTANKDVVLVFIAGCVPYELPEAGGLILV
jgi:hypothetical protein